MIRHDTDVADLYVNYDENGNYKDETTVHKHNSKTITT